MKAFDFEAVIFFDGAVRCVGCLPDGITADHIDVHPIFANSEWDYYPTCDVCGCQHEYVTLTRRGERGARCLQI